MKGSNFFLIILWHTKIFALQKTITYSKKQMVNTSLLHCLMDHWESRCSFCHNHNRSVWSAFSQWLEIKWVFEVIITYTCFGNIFPDIRSVEEEFFILFIWKRPARYSIDWSLKWRGFIFLFFTFLNSKQNKPTQTQNIFFLNLFYFT